MLDPHRLRVLKAVVDSGSVTRAAGDLGYTPSAISQSISTLEREVKTPLFERVGRGLEPTEAGIVLADHAQAVLAQIERAESALEALRAGTSGKVRLAAFSTAGASLVPRALARFKEDRPGVELDVRIVETSDALQLLRARHVDIAIVAEHERVSLGVDLHQELLMKDGYRIIVPRSHPSARRGSIALEDLRSDPWIATASARCNSVDAVTKACARVGFLPTFDLEADEFATAIGYVAAGLGITMVPLLAMAALPDGVRACRIRGDGPQRFVYCVTRVGNADEPSVAALKNALVSSAASWLSAAA